MSTTERASTVVYALMSETRLTPTRRHALVTGASSGIGREISGLLAADGYDLEIVGRNLANLEGVAGELRARHGVSVRCFPRDLSNPGAPSQLWNDLMRLGVEVDVLVNNAGIGLYGPLKQSDAGTLAGMLQLNVVALTALTRLALPGMLERRWGRILNVASLVGYQPGGPGMATYYASKAYVLSFSKGLARELKGTGVSVTALCPGPTETAFEEKSGANNTVLYKWLPKTTARAVAVAGYRGMLRKSMVVVPGVLAKILAFGGELPPRQVALEVNELLLRQA